MIRLTSPITEVLLNGRVVLSRDIGHKYMKEQKPEWLKPILENMVIYHCGPVVKKNADGTWSNPSFVRLTGGSIGFQAGVQSTSTPPAARAACWPSASSAWWT